MTLLGAPPGAGTTEPSACSPASAVPEGEPPRTHVPPIAHEHVLPEQLQSPEHVGPVSPLSSLEPQATNARSAVITKTPRIDFIGG